MSVVKVVERRSEPSMADLPYLTPEELETASMLDENASLDLLAAVAVWRVFDLLEAVSQLRGENERLRAVVVKVGSANIPTRQAPAEGGET